MANIDNELNNYQIVPRDLIFDKTLSDRARFVYVFMVCKPDDWNFYLEPMAREIGYSVDTLRKYINELVISGWVVKGSQSNKNGTFGAVKYTIKATKISDTENFRHGNNQLQINKDIKEIKTEIIKEEDTNVSPKKNDYHAIVECWNECNGKRLGKVTKVTQRRKAAIKKALVDNDITQEQLMQFFKTLPFADSWLYNPNKQHKNWKPDFDWWLANTNGWLTKGLEGKVHLENPQAYSSIMGGDDAPYRPQTDGNIHWNDYYKCYIFIGMFWDEVMDGYTDDNRPNGATLTLNNGGTIVWNKALKKWEVKK